MIASWSPEDHFREESWLELFYDLLYVAVALSLGRKQPGVHAHWN